MEPFSSTSLRRILYAMLALALVLQAIAIPYEMDADVVSYLDLAQLLRAHQWHWLVNAYWHPGYPALLAVSEIVTRVSVWHELAAARLLNLVTAFALLAAVQSALTASLRLREALASAGADDDSPASQPIFLSEPTLRLLTAALAFFVILHDFGLAAVRPDLLLAVLLVAAIGFLLRIAGDAALARTNPLPFAATGLCFGLAYWVKSVTFPLFLAAFVLTAWSLLRRPTVKLRCAALGLAAFALVFAAIAGPYIAALSHQKHRFTTGDSGGLNYAWYVDNADRFELEPGQPSRYGLASGSFKHTSTQLLATPRVYYYGPSAAAPGLVLMPVSTPQWFDPSYWDEGLRPHFHLGAQLRTIKNNLVTVGQYALMRPQLGLLGLALILLGLRWRRRDFGRLALAPVLLLLAAQMGLYLLVLTEARYVGVAVLLGLVVSLPFLRLPEETGTGLSTIQHAAGMVAVLFCAFVLAAAYPESLRSLKLEKKDEGRANGAYNRATFTAAEDLAATPGIRPGDTVACFGEAACRDDPYWARLAGISMRTEIYEEQDPLSVWLHADQAVLLATVRATGAKAIVANFGPVACPPPEWHRLGTGHYFALFL